MEGVARSIDGFVMCITTSSLSLRETFKQNNIKGLKATKLQVSILKD
jgi:hypothetical protein